MVTGQEDPSRAVEAMKLGACDFSEKPFDERALIRLLRATLERGCVTETGSNTRRVHIRRIAECERHVLDHLVGGDTSQEIGRVLDFSPRLVGIDRAKRITKTQAAHRQELVRWWMLSGLRWV